MEPNPLDFMARADVALQHYEKCPMVIGVSHESTPIYDALVLENLAKSHDDWQTRWRATHADLSQ